VGNAAEPGTRRQRNVRRLDHQCAFEKANFRPGEGRRPGAGAWIKQIERAELHQLSKRVRFKRDRRAAKRTEDRKRRRAKSGRRAVGGRFARRIRGNWTDEHRKARADSEQIMSSLRRRGNLERDSLKKVSKEGGGGKEQRGIKRENHHKSSKSRKRSRGRSESQEEEEKVPKQSSALNQDC